MRYFGARHFIVASLAALLGVNQAQAQSVADFYRSKTMQMVVGFSAGSGYAITRDSKNADAAWIYTNDYLSTAGQSYMWGITGRGSPARLSAWPSYLGSKFAPAGAKYIKESLETFASHDILDQPTAPKVTQAAQPIWDLVVAGQLKVKDALDQIAAAIEPIIAENRG